MGIHSNPYYGSGSSSNEQTLDHFCSTVLEYTTFLEGLRMADDVNTHLIDNHRRITHARLLNILAALVWCLGGVILLVKGGKLLAGSVSLFPGPVWPWVAAISGLLLGGVKGEFLFSKSCKNNLIRISSLKNPRIWQFFSPAFFVLLLLMIAAGVVLSRLAHTSFPILVGIVILDLAVGAALLASSCVFWQQKAFSLLSSGGSVKP